MTDTSDDERPTMGSLGYTEQFTWGSEDDPDPPVAKRHWGKYRGTVIDNQDVPPKGRLLVSVPGIVITNWAMPCVPFASVSRGDVHTAGDQFQRLGRVRARRSRQADLDRQLVG